MSLRFSLPATLAAVILMCTAATAQVPAPSDSREHLKEGIALFKDQKYRDAIDVFYRVNRSDTNYAFALYEIAFAHMRLEEYDKAEALCREALDLPQCASHSEIYRLYGNVLSNAERLDESKAVFHRGLRDWPNDYLLHYNLAIVHLKKHNLDSALAGIIRALEINPFHYSSHVQLGILHRMYGGDAQAVLSLLTAQLIDASGRFSETVLTELERASQGLPYTGELVYGSGSIIKQGQDEFPLIERIIDQRVALQPSYKRSIKMDYKFTRQMQAIMERLHYTESDKGFWMQFYVPLYARLAKEGRFKYVAYYALRTIKDDHIQQWLKKNDKGVKQFASDFMTHFREQSARYPVYVNGQPVLMPHYQYGIENLRSVGRYNAKQTEMVGPWYFFYRNGALNTAGTLNASGARDGAWVDYHDNGRLAKQESYASGKLHGPAKTFHYNGSPRREGTFVNGVLNGPYKEFYPSGALLAEGTHVNDKLHGPYKVYYNSGGIRRTLSYANGKIEGSYDEFTEFGKAYQVAHYKAGNLDGSFKRFHPNGTLYILGTYKDNEPVGPWVWFHDTGDTAKVGNYVKGTATGNWREYYRNGTLETSITYNANGQEIDSRYYDTDGKLHMTVKARDKVPEEISFFDKTGKEIAKTTRNGQDHYAKRYHPKGYLESEGLITPNGRSGVWKYYFPNGTLARTVRYNNDARNGPNLAYFRNGQLRDSVNWVDNERHGRLVSYHRNGVKETEGWFLNDERQGDWYEYNEFGVLMTKTHYADGEEDGFLTNYDELGRIRNESFYQNTALMRYRQFDTTGLVINTQRLEYGNGPLRQLHPNGKTHVLGGYKHNERIGAWQWLQADSTASTSEQFELGFRHGPVSRRDALDQPMYTGAYNYGKRTGQWEIYHLGTLDHRVDYDSLGNRIMTTWFGPNGKMEQVSRYDPDDDGVRSGPTEYYNGDGEWLVTLFYHGDFVTGFTYPGADGKPVATVPFAATDTVIRGFFANGKPSIVLGYRNGYRHGRMTTYYSNGKVYEDVVYTHDWREGALKRYSAKGTLLAEETFGTSDLHGPSTYYYDNGVKKLEARFIDDEPHGTWRYYDRNGKLTHTHVYYAGLLLSKKG